MVQINTPTSHAKPPNTYAHRRIMEHDLQGHETTRRTNYS